MDKILALISYGLGLYIGIWHLLIKSIINAYSMFSAGTLTGIDVAFTVFKCFISFPVAYMVTVIIALIIAIVRELIIVCIK